MTTTTHAPGAAERAAATARATWYPAVARIAAQTAYTDVETVESGSQCDEAVLARRIIMATAHHLGMSASAIGALLGLHHSTVMYGQRAVREHPALVRANALSRDLADAIHRRAAA